MSAHTYILMQLASDVKIVNRLPAFSSSSFASASNILERNLIDRQKKFLATTIYYTYIHSK